MVGHIFIHGIIGNPSMFEGDISNEPFIDLEGIMSQVLNIKKTSQPTSYLVHISSPGGSVDSGDSIYDYLIDLRKDGTIVNTITDGDVGSIATKIFLAGNKRTIVGNHEFFIHNPWIDGASGEAKDLEDTAAELRDIEKELAKFYASKTGHSTDGILSLMKKGTGVKGQQAVDLGFATEHLAVPVKAKVMAFIPKKQKQKKMSKLKELKEKVNRLLAMFEESKKLNIDMSLENGAIIRIADAETEEMAVGKPAVIVDAEGVETPAPEGQHTLADGRTVTIDANGIVVSIDGGETANEISLLQAQIKQLQEKLEAKSTAEKALEDEDVEGMITALKKTNKKLKKAKKEIERDRAELAAMRTHFKIPVNKTFLKEQKEEGKINIKEELEARKAKRDAMPNLLTPVKS